MGDSEYEQRGRREKSTAPQQAAPKPGGQSLHEPSYGAHAASNAIARPPAATFRAGVTPWPSQSRVSDRVFGFEPETIMLDGAQPQHVCITNLTDQPQTLDEHELVGDTSSFEVTLGKQSVQLAPGQVIWFQVRLASSDDQPRAAALLVRSVFNQSAPARLLISGVGSTSSATQRATGAGVAISATTPAGRANTITSALISVSAAWTAVQQQQQAALHDIKAAAQKDPPMPSGAWKEIFDGVIAEGLLRAVGAIVNHYSGGLTYAVWNVLQRLRLDASAIAAEKAVTAMTADLHKALLSGFTKGVAADQIGRQREALLKDNVVPATLRDAFFDTQERALAVAYVDNVTAVSNREGDFAALETQHPGLGFAALEAYRNHIMSNAGRVLEIQRHQTLGMWSAFQAQLALGVHEPKGWEQAREGAALERNAYVATDARHQLRTLARGVLEIGVAWNYDRRRHAPIKEIRHARIRGLQPELRQLLTQAPLHEYNMPVIVHGKVLVDSYAAQGDRETTSHLRIARNEGGAITLGAESGTKGAEMLDDLGSGDAYAGARALLTHVDGLTLTRVD